MASIEIEIVINGQTVQIPSDQSIDRLLERLGICHRAIAVELNSEIQLRSGFDSTIIESGDKVEIVTLVGGG